MGREGEEKRLIEAPLRRDGGVLARLLGRASRARVPGRRGSRCAGRRAGSVAASGAGHYASILPGTVWAASGTQTSGGWASGSWRALGSGSVWLARGTSGRRAVRMARPACRGRWVSRQSAGRAGRCSAVGEVRETRRGPGG
jgi:hypothetical protein